MSARILVEAKMVVVEEAVMLDRPRLGDVFPREFHEVHRRQSSRILVVS